MEMRVLRASLSRRERVGVRGSVKTPWLNSATVHGARACRWRGALIPCTHESRVSNRRGLHGEPRVASVDVTVRDAGGLRAAVAAAKPGTRILMAPGTYPGGFSFSNLRGATNLPVVIAAADPANPPVIQGGANGMQLTDPAFVELHDLAFTGATGTAWTSRRGVGRPCRWRKAVALMGWHRVSWIRMPVIFGKARQVRCVRWVRTHCPEVSSLAWVSWSKGPRRSARGPRKPAHSGGAT